MAYPRPPIDKQYGPLFPEIPGRAVPSDDSVKKVEQAPLALHSEGQSSAEALGPPKKMDMGVLRIWVEGAGRKSKAFDDGPTFDYKAHGLTKPKEEGEDGFNIAPGTDEKNVTIGWEVYGLPNIKSAKLELFGADVFQPIWEHHWGDAWGKKKAEIADFVSKTGDKQKVSVKGSLKLTEIKPDTGIQATGADGKKAAAFPKGLLTVARSPYQLRLTVSGCTAKDTPADGDKLVYPMTAWTYLHVLVDSFTFKFGDYKSLKARDDIDKEFTDAVLGGSGKKGHEEILVERLTGFAANPNKDTMHVVALQADYNKAWSDAKDYEFDAFAKMWGKGPRIPLVATAKIRTLGKGSTADKAADVLVGAGVMWDWEEADPKRLEKLTSATQTVGDGRLSADFLKGILKESSTSEWPKGSYNCPAQYDGRLGTDDPVFVQGPDAYKLIPLKARKSAAVTPFDDKGETAVTFWPSRFAGDDYRIKAYLSNETFVREVDKQEEIKDPPTAVGSPGVFTIYRRVTVHHLVIGNLPGLDAKAARDSAVAAARDQACLLIDFVVPDLGNFKVFMDEVAKNLVMNSKRAASFAFGGLEFPLMLRLDQAGDWLFKVVASSAFKAQLEDLFKNGRIRLVKKTIKLFEEGFGFCEQVVGKKNGSKGFLLDLGTKMADGQEILYAITEPGQPAFEDGESVDGVHSGKPRTLTFYKKMKSCWKVTVAHRPDTTYGKDVVVRIPGQTDTRLVFPRSGLKRNYSSVLTSDMKTTIKNAFVAGMNAWDESRMFSILLLADDGATDRSGTRVESVRDYLDELAASEIVERGPIHDAFQAQNGVFYRMDNASFADAVFGDDLQDLIFQTLAYTYLKKAKVTEGLVAVHVSRASSLTSNAEDAKGTKGDKKADYLDFTSGGYIARGDATAKKDQIGLAEPELKKVGVIKLITPNPSAATTFKAKPVKKAWAVLVHEMGHAFWLPHAKARPGQVGAPSVQLGEHVKDEACIMSYDAEADQLCALCMLRLRGWRWKSVRREVGSANLRIGMKLGNVESIFANRANVDAGKLERMQVLGLFMRPFTLEGDEKFGDEFEECREYCWNLTKETLPGVESDPAEVFAKHVKEFIVEGGELPAATAEARIRVAAHYNPYYANMDMALRYMDATKKDARENQFKMMAIRGDVEALTQGANPAMGAYPIEIVVTDDKGAAAPDEEIWLELVKPKAPLAAYDTNFSGTKLLGGTSFVKGTSAPAFDTPVLKHVKKWMDDNVAAHDASGDDDPQKDNVHYEMGGKRRMTKTGDVLSPDAEGWRNVFSARSGRTVAPIDGTGKVVPHAIRVRTDMDGVARVLFTPSTVGGDSYRLKASVHEGDDKKEVGSVETGNMVMWRAHRIGGYWQMPTVASVGELKGSPAHYINHTSKAYRADKLKPLAPFDVKSSIGHELARSYCEVVFEDAALAPQPLDRAYWDRFTKRTEHYDTKNVELIQIFAKATLAEVALGRVPGNVPEYRGRVSGTVRRWNLGVKTSDDTLNRGFHTIFAEIDPNSADTADTVPLVQLKNYDKLFSFADDVALESPFLEASKDSTVVNNLKGELESGTFTYSTGEVVVKLKKDPAKSPAKLLDGSPQWVAKIVSVTGATPENTHSGVLYFRIQQSGSKYDVLFFKNALRRKQDLVAAVKGKRASDDASNPVRARATAKNKSGITVELEMGADPLDDAIGRVWCGMDFLIVQWVPEKIIDRSVVMSAPDRSPWLFNFTPPEEYNQKRDPSVPAAPPQTFKMDDYNWWEGVLGVKNDHTLGETVFMRSASGALRGGQGDGFYPGQLYLQAQYVNPMSGGLRGKGTGNTAFLFNEGADKADFLFYLVLHETGHCLYGVHSWDEGGYNEAFHDPSHAYLCIMGGPGELEVDTAKVKSLRTFCGKCNAGLRGVLVMEPPLYPTSESSKQGAPKPGDAKTARKPKLGSVTGGLVLQPQPTVDPHPTPPSRKPTDDDNVLADGVADIEVDDDDISCDVDFKPQEKSLWCWAAVTQMMRKYYGKEDLTQTKIVKDATGNTNDQEYALPLIGLQSDASKDGTALTFDEIQQEIDADRPFIFGNSRHYMVCYGYKDSTHEVLVYDPLPVNAGSTRRVGYDAYKSLIETGELGRRGANYSNIRTT